MKYRTLGRTGFHIGEIGYGAWGIGGKLWHGGSDDESLRALRRAMELGVNFIDTALVYGDGHSEKLVGKAIREARHRMFVATKVPPKNRLWPARPGIAIENVFPFDYIVHSTEESLRNLRVDTIDLQQLHVWNPEWLDQDDWQRAFEELKISGKVRGGGRFDQRSSAGFGAEPDAERLRRRRAGDLQHFRSEPRAGSFSAGPANEYRRNRARAIR